MVDWMLICSDVVLTGTDTLASTKVRISRYRKILMIDVIFAVAFLILMLVSNEE